MTHASETGGGVGVGQPVGTRSMASGAWIVEPDERGPGQPQGLADDALDPELGGILDALTHAIDGDPVVADAARHVDHDRGEPGGAVERELAMCRRDRQCRSHRQPGRRSRGLDRSRARYRRLGGAEQVGDVACGRGSEERQQHESDHEGATPEQPARGRASPIRVATPAAVPAGSLAGARRRQPEPAQVVQRVGGTLRVAERAPQIEGLEQERLAFARVAERQGPGAELVGGPCPVRRALRDVRPLGRRHERRCATHPTGRSAPAAARSTGRGRPRRRTARGAPRNRRRPGARRARPR